MFIDRLPQSELVQCYRAARTCWVESIVFAPFSYPAEEHLWIYLQTTAATSRKLPPPPVNGLVTLQACVSALPSPED